MVPSDIFANVDVDTLAECMGAWEQTQDWLHGRRVAHPVHANASTSEGMLVGLSGSTLHQC